MAHRYESQLNEDITEEITSHIWNSIILHQNELLHTAKGLPFTLEDLKYINGHHQFVQNDDGTLFSGAYRTKIKSEDLPEWYMYGRYYKRRGYMSTKGITDLVYIPSLYSNHYLKDDCLLVAYGGKITEKENASTEFSLDKYAGWDERVWGFDIVTILIGARKYSGYAIEPFIEKLAYAAEIERQNRRS